MSPFLAPTLTDVAKKAGVSTATVSRYLNMPNRVAKHTRGKVEDAITTLGYTPNFGARVMASKRTYTIGAIIPTMENAIFARGLQAFQDELHTKGYTLLVASSSYDPKIEEEQIRTLITRGAEGLLLIGHDRSQSIIDYLEIKNIPALVAWAYEKKARLPSIGFDNFEAMSQLAKYVLSLGHKKIAMISGKTKFNDRARARVLAVQRSMEDTGLNPAELNLIETDYGIEQGAVAFNKIMKNQHPPSIIICGNDVLAAGIVKHAKTIGVAIPDDVAITGFDDLELAQVLDPELSTVKVPHYRMGQGAARILIEMLEGNFFNHATKLQTELKIRASLNSKK